MAVVRIFLLLLFLGSGHSRVRQLPSAVSAFLHTGDSSSLRPGNCSGRVELPVSGRARGEMRGVLDSLLHTVSFLQQLLRAEEGVAAGVAGALVRSLLEADGRIQRAVLRLERPPVYLQVTRGGAGELTRLDPSHLRNRSAETEWFHRPRSGRHAAVHWSAPHLQCEEGRWVPRWILTLSAACYSLKANHSPDFRGVVRVDVSLQDVDIDQCSSEGWFAQTHRCNLTTTQCRPLSGHGFVLDKYQCDCRSGYYHPSRVTVSAGPRKAGRKGVAGWPHHRTVPEASSQCLPCQDGCAFCQDDTPCAAGGDGALRMAVLSFQGLCMLLDFICMVLLYHFRRNKSIRASGLVLLEAILFGALLLYFPVAILFFQPSVFRCVLLRWVRLLGFATVYGTLTLKLYRVLKVFLSRTAQRIPYMTSWRVLRLLCVILLVVLWFAVAWTASVCHTPDPHHALISTGFTAQGLQFSLCLLDRWDYMTAVAEFLFLLWAVYLCYAVRTVPSAFHEPRFMAIAVHNELVLSAVFHVLRFTLASELHPDWMLMLFFAHTHLTVTVTLGLLLVPKFLFAGAHLRDDIATEAYEDELDMGRSGSYLNSSITSAWSEHSLDPEDIREELKKLYSQLEIYKRKKMLANNPHLQKKRSSKKGLGRSLMRRITEIPESMGRQCSRDDKDEHASNRNSICVLRKNPFEPSHALKTAKEETLKSKVLSLKKSHSSYDHVRDHDEDAGDSVVEVASAEGSLLETLMGKKLARKSSEKIDAVGESTESVPLVCKSASAHNLTADKKPLHPRTSMLQKSLSVIASAKEKTLGLTGKAPAPEEPTRKPGEKSKDVKVECKDKDDSAKQTVSQSANSKPTAKAGIMKPPMSGGQGVLDLVKSKDLYDLSEVCPWELEDLPVPSDKVQKHVSIAPETPQHKQKDLSTSPADSRHPSKTPADRADVCPWEEHKEEQSKGLSVRPHGNTKSATSHTQAAVPGAKGPRAEVCPWDFEEPQDVVCSEERSKPKKTQLQARATIVSGPAEVKSKASVSTDKAKEPKAPDCSLPPSAREEVCPWDFEEPQNIVCSPERSKPKKSSTQLQARVSGPAEVKSKAVVPTDKAKEPKAPDCSLQTHAREEVCPWDFEEPQDVVCSPERSKPKKSSTQHQARATIVSGPAEVKSKAVVPTDKAKEPKAPDCSLPPHAREEVCPWDFDTVCSPTSEKTCSSPGAKTKEVHATKKGAVPHRTSDKAKLPEEEKAKTALTGKYAARQTNERAANQANERAASQTNERAASQANERAASQTNEKVASQANERAASQTNDRAASQTNERAASQANERAASQANERAASQANERAASQTNERAASQANERAASQANERAASQANERAASQTNERAASQANERAVSQTNERAASQTNERAASQANERAVSQTNERTASQANERAASQTNERAASQTNERAASQANERAASQANERAASQANERAASQAKLAEVCPWDVDCSQEVLSVEKPSSPNVPAAKSKREDVCPWDFEEAEATRRSGASNNRQKGSVAGAFTTADVCPWDFDDETSTKKT